MNKLVPLLAMTVVLGAFVWMDNQATQPLSVAATPSVEEPPTAGTDDFTERSPPSRADVAEEINTAEPADIPQSGEELENPAETNSNPLASLDKTALRDMVERPLFAPSRRRPPVVEKGNAVAAPATPETFELLGIAKANQRTIALVRRVTDGTSFRLQAGDSVDNWTLAKIERASITLNGNDGSTAVVQLGPSKKPCVPGSSAACPAQPPQPDDFTP